MQVQTRGEFGGLGIEVTMEDGLIKVVSPIDDTPAAKAGVMANDIITQLDDEQVQGLTLNQAVEKMRGPVNTKIKLTIMRKGQDKPIEVSITRDVIRVRAVRSQVEGDDVGYIRITQFNEQTTEGLKKAIDDLTAQDPRDKLKGFVVDLRNNPGGLLDQAIAVSDAFLRGRDRLDPRPQCRGDAALQRPRRRPHQGQAGHRADQRRLGLGLGNRRRRAAGPQARDHLGTRSFGKGSVQTIIPLGAGNGALRLTTARYFTPSGRSIQAKGIAPDIEVLQDVPDELKARTDTKGEASLRGHLKAEGDEADRLAVLRPAGSEERQGAATWRSTCSAAPRSTRPSRRIRSARCRTERGHRHNEFAAGRPSGPPRSFWRRAIGPVNGELTTRVLDFGA